MSLGIEAKSNKEKKERRAVIVSLSKTSRLE
jgi:hypothetical protein